VSHLFRYSVLPQACSGNLFRVLATLLCLGIGTLHAAEYQLNEDIAPETAQEASLGLDSIASDAESPPRRSLLNVGFEDASPFWRDSESVLDFRVFDFDRDSGLGDLSEATAAGTELSFTSGKIRDRLSLSATWHS
jgi:hypothetical protein